MQFSVVTATNYVRGPDKLQYKHATRLHTTMYKLAEPPIHRFLVFFRTHVFFSAHTFKKINFFLSIINFNNFLKHIQKDYIFIYILHTVPVFCTSGLIL